jgi:tetratricopeptide (TPR) repeat protein
MEHGRCLTDETLVDYLEGSLDHAIRTASEVHLVACDNCRHRLGFFMRVLQEEVTSDEAGTLRVIESKWGEKKGELTVRSGSRRRLWAMTAAALLIGVVSAQFLLQRFTEPTAATQVVELLLNQQRPFEVRMANQPYLPRVQTRGTADTDVAYELLAGEMTRLSADGHQMGRFYLLQKDFTRAIGYLEMAERQIGAGPEVHNDLGVAYLEGGGEMRAQRAADEFRHALTLDPSFAPASFNMAICYERTNALSQAESQWRHFLQLDRDSPWAAEARSRLQGLSQ